MRRLRPQFHQRFAPVLVPVALLALCLVLVALALQRPQPPLTVPPTAFETTAPSGWAVPSPTTPGTVAPYEPDCTAIPTLRRLSVMTFNIHSAVGHGPGGLERVAQEIAAAKVDVVLLQEVDRFRAHSGVVDQPAWLARRLGMHSAFGNNVTRRPARAGGPAQEYGTAVLSRFPILRQENRHLPNDATHQQRGLLRAELDLGEGARIAVFNTHFDHGSAELRIAQSHATAAVVSRERIPVLLGGDLNSQPTYPAVTPLTRVLRDAWPSGGDPGYTVSAKHPRRRIDYVLHDPSFHVESAQVIQSAVSDHRAVRVGLILARPGKCAGQ